jgi:hypothetical protein
VADINDRLERISRRDELARRARERAVPPAIAGVGTDFMEVVEAVAAVVRRHSGMSVMIAPGDGRRRSAVIRVTERHGEVEVAPVSVAGPADEFGEPDLERSPEFIPGPPQGSPQELSYPDLAPSGFTHPSLLRPDLRRMPPAPGHPGASPPRGPEPAGTWRPPPTEPQPQQPGPYESSPADGWGWER